MVNSRPDASESPGGDTVQIRETRTALERLGVTVSVRDPARLQELPPYDVAHVFNLQMPENAAGTTTVRLVCTRVAPRAYDASRSPSGTARIASSVSDETRGRIMIPMTIPGLSALNPASDGMICCRSGVTNNSAK